MNRTKNIFCDRLHGIDRIFLQNLNGGLSSSSLADGTFLCQSLFGILRKFLENFTTRTESSSDEMFNTILVEESIFIDEETNFIEDGREFLIVVKIKTKRGVFLLLILLLLLFVFVDGKI